jgi:hypothetical protein
MPWDTDSFIYPVVRELLELAIGVSAYDAVSRSLFALHAYVITGFGDISAVFMLMHMKGRNATCPCRKCRTRILGIRIPGARNKTLYAPQSSRTNRVVEYRPEKLPLRSRDYFMAQAALIRADIPACDTQRRELPCIRRRFSSFVSQFACWRGL